MNITPKFLARKHDDKIVIYEKTLFTNWLESFQEGEYLEVVIRKRWKQRSEYQNKYLFGVVYQMISDYTGYTPKQVHYEMRILFLNNGSELISTTRLSTQAFNEYIENILYFAASFFEIVIPYPNDIDLQSKTYL